MEGSKQFPEGAFNHAQTLQWLIQNNDVFGGMDGVPFGQQFNRECHRFVSCLVDEKDEGIVSMAGSPPHGRSKQQQPAAAVTGREACLPETRYRALWHGIYLSKAVHHDCVIGPVKRNGSGKSLSKSPI